MRFTKRKGRNAGFRPVVKGLPMDKNIRTVGERLEFGWFDLKRVSALKAVAFKMTLVPTVNGQFLCLEKGVPSPSVLQWRDFRDRTIILLPEKPAVQYPFCGAFAVASRVAPTEAVRSPHKNHRKT